MPIINMDSAHRFKRFLGDGMEQVTALKERKCVVCPSVWERIVHW